MTRQTDTHRAAEGAARLASAGAPARAVGELILALQDSTRRGPAALIRAHTPPRRAIEDHLLTTSRPRPVDPDTAAEQALRLRREDAQARFNRLGLPRATRLSEVTP